MGRTAPLTSKRCILYIYSTSIDTEYFKHALYSPFFSLQNAVCFIMLTCLVPVLLTFYIQGVLKLKKNYSGAKGLISTWNRMLLVQVTVIQLIEKFTTVSETKGHLQHHRIPPVCLIVSQCNAFSILTAYSCEIHFNIHPSTPRFIKYPSHQPDCCT